MDKCVCGPTAMRLVIVSRARTIFKPPRIFLRASFFEGLALRLTVKFSSFRFRMEIWRGTTGTLLGADEYIVKPVDRAILLAAMDRSLNLRGKIEEENSILVVEDDPATHEFIKELLTNRGYMVRAAADGAQARAQVQASLPRLVILDLILPKVSGLQLMAEWRADPRTADLPIFVLTNKDLSQDEREYLRANTEAFFSKQEQWLEALIKQIRRAVPSVIAEES
jgi:CheY-like chemotaxis protein